MLVFVVFGIGIVYLMSTMPATFTTEGTRVNFNMASSRSSNRDVESAVRKVLSQGGTDAEKLNLITKLLNIRPQNETTAIQSATPTIARAHTTVTQNDGTLDQGRFTSLCTPAQMQTRLVPITSAVQPVLTARRYNSGCKTIGRNYRCKSSSTYRAYLENDSRRQVPEAAANGSCALVMNDGQYPFPAGSRILFWGNSHMRQILHSIACQYPDAGAITRGSDQDSVCDVKDYKVTSGRGEIIWETMYGNNATIYGVCNCGLMYNRETALNDVAAVIGVNYSTLTHVVGNPANVAKWAVDWKFTACAQHPWYQALKKMNKTEKFFWTPFPEPELLGAELKAHGFKGRLIWSLPFWCMSNQRANR